MHEIFVPVMGMAPDEVTLVSWLKATGDPVAVGEAVAVVETAKADLEIESAWSGILGRQLFPEMAQIIPGATIAYILGSGESEPSPDPLSASETASSEQGSPAPPGEHTVDTGEAADSSPIPDSDPAADGAARARHTQSPRQRRLAKEGRVAPSPEQTTVTAPARGAASSTAASPSDTDAGGGDSWDADNRYRRAISASVSRSWQEIPHFAVTRELRVDELVGAVGRWRAVIPGLTLTDLLLRALALSFLERERHGEFDVGLAVATERGVAIPVLRNVLRLGLAELVDARRAAVERARDVRMDSDDVRVPVTTLSNLGAVGVDQFTGIVPFGQTSLLTAGVAAQRPVIHDGQLAVGTTMHVTLNVDHRSWDGLHAGQLLDRFARIVDIPGLFFGPDIQAPTSLMKDLP